MKIRAITFDVGGTLIEPWPSVGHVYAEVAARHGVRNASAALLEARFRAAWQARPGFENSRAGWEAVVDAAFAGLVERPPRETFFGELYERFAEAAAWRVFDDVLPALDALAARGLALGIVSNWDERLPVLLRRLGLFPRFKTVIVSHEAGVSKPSSAIFNHAAPRSGCRRGKCCTWATAMNSMCSGRERPGSMPCGSGGVAMAVATTISCR